MYSWLATNFDSFDRTVQEEMRNKKSVNQKRFSLIG